MGVLKQSEVFHREDVTSNLQTLKLINWRKNWRSAIIEGPDLMSWVKQQSLILFKGRDVVDLSTAWVIPVQKSSNWMAPGPDFIQSHWFPRQA